MRTSKGCGFSGQGDLDFSVMTRLGLARLLVSLQSRPIQRERMHERSQSLVPEAASKILIKKQVETSRAEERAANVSH
jgi:hypothetical protein